MKKSFVVSLMMITGLIIASCGSSNDVVSNRLISKRKYNKGFFINKKSKLKSDNSEEEKKDVAVLEREKSSKKVDRKIERANKKLNKELASSNEYSMVTDVNTENYLKELKKREESEWAIKRLEDNAESDEVSNPWLGDMNNPNGVEDNSISEEDANTETASNAYTRNGSSLLQIILIILLIIAIIALLSLLPHWISWILSVIFLAIVIWLLLRILGVI